MKSLKIIEIITCMVFLNHSAVVGQNSGDLELKQFPKIVSATPTPGIFKSIHSFNYAERVVQYIGAVGDTLLFGPHKMNFMRKQKVSRELLMRAAFNSLSPDSNLSILIDTTQVIGVEEINYNLRDYKTVLYASYPVIIQNISDSTLVLGIGRKIPLSIEAMDQSGKWKVIEDDMIYRSGTGMAKIFLKSKEVVGVCIPVFSGNFKTLLRIKVCDSYSNPFTGTINYTQFK